MANPVEIMLPEYAPDLTPIGTGVSSVILGVVPRRDGYGPFQSFTDFTQALPANCRGFFFARNTDGSISVFAGTDTRLYRLSNTTFAWVDVSQGAVAYAALVTDQNWRFAQFNTFVIAVQINTVPQKFVLGSATEFVDLGGMPPQASHIAIINRFVMLTGLLSNPNRAQWCDLGAPESWTAGVGLADFQDQPDGGRCFAISGGDAYGLLFQDECIRSLTYAPGSPAVFQFTRIATQDTLFAQYSIITAGDKTFFCSAQGFRQFSPGGGLEPIGKDKVDTTFFADVDRANLQLMIGATDPTATRVYWAYKSLQGNAGLFDKMLCYDWNLKKWSLIPMSGQYLAYLAKPGLTLEQLDAIAPGALQVTGAADNGSGAIRLTLNEISNAYFQIAGQNFIVVQGVEGTTEANGAWVPTIIDATHIDLVGSTFTNAYVSGGAIGGSLDALPFSLDSISTAAVAQLAAVGPASTLGFFTGDNIEAVLETDEQDAKGNVIFIGEGIRPITDSPDVMVSVSTRMRAQDVLVYSTEIGLTFTGLAPMTIESRYMRARMRIPAGSAWTYAKSVQPDAKAAGLQ